MTHGDHGQAADVFEDESYLVAGRNFERLGAVLHLVIGGQLKFNIGGECTGSGNQSCENQANFLHR